MSKLRVIKDYQKLDKDLQEQVKLMYPDGFSQHLIEFNNAKGEIVSALPFETDEYMYLLKMSVRTAQQIIEDDDDYDDEGNLIDQIREKYEGEYGDPNLVGEEDSNPEEEGSDDDFTDNFDIDSKIDPAADDDDDDEPEEEN